MEDTGTFKLKKVLVPSNTTRGHSFSGNSAGYQRLPSFSIRVIDQCNNLSDSTVTSTTLNTFKSVLNEEDWNHFKYINSC